MPAADLIDAGEVDRYVNDWRNCRDRGIQRDCDAYARQRMQARHPNESPRSIDSVARHGRNAVDYGNRANQTANQNVPATFPGQDPAATQYGSGNRGTIRYVYGTQVSVTMASGPNAGHVFPITVIVYSDTPLTAGEIRQSAVDEGQRLAQQYMRDSDRLAGADLSVTADVRITSTYRDRV